MSGVKQEHVTIALNEKLKVLRRMDKGEPQKIAKKLNVGDTTIKDWRKNRKDIESFTVMVEGEKALISRWIKKWRNIAAKSRLWSAKQKNIIFSLKNVLLYVLFLLVIRPFFAFRQCYQPHR